MLTGLGPTLSLSARRDIEGQTAQGVHRATLARLDLAISRPEQTQHMSLGPRLLHAMVAAGGDAVVVHTGDLPYVAVGPCRGRDRH